MYIYIYTCSVYVHVYVHVVVVITRCRVQYGKDFASFSYFTTYFLRLQASEIKATYEKQRKYMAILYDSTCDNYFIVKCLLKSNVTRVILLRYLLIALSWLNISKNCKY